MENQMYSTFAVLYTIRYIHPTSAPPPPPPPPPPPFPPTPTSPVPTPPHLPLSTASPASNPNNILNILCNQARETLVWSNGCRTSARGTCGSTVASMPACQTRKKPLESRNHWNVNNAAQWNILDRNFLCTFLDKM